MHSTCAALWVQLRWLHGAMLNTAAHERWLELELETALRGDGED